MIRKLLKSQTGSTLIMVLMTLSVLSILGTAAMSLGVMNLKMKTVDRRQKISFYLSEAGLEEAYGIMMKKVEAGIKKGNENVGGKLPQFIRNERSEQFAEESTYKSPYLNVDGSVDEEKIKVKLQEWFTQGYIDYLNKKDSNDKYLLKLEIEKLDNYTVLDTSLDTSKPTIEVNTIKEYAKMNVPITKYSETKKYIEDYSQNSKFEITLTSKFEHKNIEKNIKSTFSINIPKYNTPYYIGNDVFKLKENVLWTKALIADKNIVVTGDNVTVNGDIYAYGDSTKKDIKERGILVGDNNKSGSLIVKGNVVTGGYFQTKAKKSEINITGDVYCDSLSIPELQEVSSEIDEDENCKITINGDVNTIDDVELNGEKSHITINGSYYGFSDGAASTKHESSSSIVINSDDIKTNSSIKITGEGEGKDYYKKQKDDGTIESGNGVFIGGTVYINLEEDYQTGESVSVKGNYRAYTEELNGEEYGKDKVEFKYFAPLNLMNKLKKQDPNKKPKPIYQQRREYIVEFDTENPNVLNLGDKNIDIENIKYSIGAYIQPNKISDESPVYGYYATALTTNEREYNYYVKKIGDPQINYLDEDIKLGEKSNIEDFFDFKTEEIADKTNNDKEVYFANSNENQAIYIVGPESKEVGDSSKYTIKPSDGVLKGIIVTKGDVYISGKIKFKGVIVTKGNIYIQDNKPKEFTNDYKTNFKGNYTIHEIIKHINKDKTQIGDLFKQDNTWSKETDSIVDESDAGVDDDVESYYKFSKLIDITKWQQSK